MFLNMQTVYRNLNKSLHPRSEFWCKRILAGLWTQVAWLGLDLQLDLDFDNNDSRLDSYLSPVTWKVFMACLLKPKIGVVINIGWPLKGITPVWLALLSLSQRQMHSASAYHIDYHNCSVFFNHIMFRLFNVSDI